MGLYHVYNAENLYLKSAVVMTLIQLTGNSYSVEWQESMWRIHFDQETV